MQLITRSQRLRNIWVSNPRVRTMSLTLKSHVHPGLESGGTVVGLEEVQAEDVVTWATLSTEWMTWQHDPTSVSGGFCLQAPKSQGLLTKFLLLTKNVIWVNSYMLKTLCSLILILISTRSKSNLENVIVQKWNYEIWIYVSQYVIRYHSLNILGHSSLKGVLIAKRGLPFADLI